MEGQSFDRFARNLASGSSRRGFLRGIFRRGASAAAVSVVGTAAIGAVQPEAVNAAGTCPGDKVPTGCACEAGLSECANDTCKDLQSDEQNCGSCGNVCATYEVCSSGTCTCPNTAEFEVCNGVCTRVYNNDVNCGFCGNQCMEHGYCNEGGSCACDTGYWSCSSSSVGTICVEACTGGRVIVNGVNCTCHCPTGSGYSDCGEAGCKQLGSDVLNCGACGNSCGAFASCTSGTCVCDNGFELCGGACRANCEGGLTRNPSTCVCE